MAEIYAELTIVIKSFHYSPPDPSVGIFIGETVVEEIGIWDGNVQIKNDVLEEYFLKNNQDELIQAIDEEAEESLDADI